MDDKKKIKKTDKFISEITKSLKKGITPHENKAKTNVIKGEIKKIIE